MIQLNNGLPCVTTALKGVITSIEPDIHQFWPIKILMPKGKVYPKIYHGMRIGTFLNSFKAAEETFHRHDPESGLYTLLHDNKKEFTNLQFRSEIFFGHHLWRENHIKTPAIYMSDELHDAISSEGLEIYKNYQAKAV
jgi:hypothetical protein